MRFSPLVAALAALVAASSLHAADSAEAPSKSTTATGHQSGVRIYVDPETGRRTTHPSDAQRRAAAAADGANPAFNQTSEGLIERPLPNGGAIVDLNGRFQSSVGVRIGKDGKREFFCDEAGNAEHDRTAPARAEREER